MKGTLRTLIILSIVIGMLSTGVLFADAPQRGYHAIRPVQTSITVGWVGDMVPSDDASYNLSVFSSVANDLQLPDLMIGNLEGTFALPERTDKCIYIPTMCHAFRGDPSFATALKDAGFDLVSLVNNHSYDYLRDGLEDTKRVLDDAGIPYISPDKPTISMQVKGKRIGVLGLSSTEPASTITDYDFIEREVKNLKQSNDYVIVIFHGGAEGSDKTEVPGTTEYMGTENRGDVQKVSYTAIDAGADLVLGSGPHVLRKIEVYKGAPIAYSLGNFVGGKHLVMGNTLSLSGIFTTTLGAGSYSLIPITLSPTGVPGHS